MIYRTLQVPALGAAQAAGTEYETRRFGAFDLSDLRGPGVGGHSAHAPEPPRAFLFLLEEKEAKDYLGGYPPKDPQGGALWPRPPKPPRPDSLVVTASVWRASRCALVA